MAWSARSSYHASTHVAAAQAWGDHEEGWAHGGDLEDDEGDGEGQGTGTPPWVPRPDGPRQPMMIAGDYYWVVDRRQRTQRVADAGGGRDGGSGPLLVRPLFFTFMYALHLGYRVLNGCVGSQCGRHDKSMSLPQTCPTMKSSWVGTSQTLHACPYPLAESGSLSSLPHTHALNG